MPPVRAFALAALMHLMILPALAADEGVNPCQGVTATCTEADGLLHLSYRMDLHNPADRSVEFRLLRAVDVLRETGGAVRGLLLHRKGKELWATVPSRWRGQVTLEAKQSIAERPGTPDRTAELSLPLAVSRAVHLDLAGTDIDLEVAPAAVVRDAPGARGRSAFRIVPLGGDVLALRWRHAPPRPTSYTFEQVHEITERAPEFVDDATLEFIFGESPPLDVAAELPPGVTVCRVLAGDARWRISEGRLLVTVPEGLGADRLTVRCRIEGTAAAEGPDAHLMRAPLLRCPDAQRSRGRVLVAGTLHELSFDVLTDAIQSAAEGWKLACNFSGPAPEVVVRVVPMVPQRSARVVSLFHVSAFKVEGTHAVSVSDPARAVTSLDVVVPEGHVVRRVTAPGLRDWVQEGRNLHVEVAAQPQATEVQVLTEELLGGRLRLSLAPPAVLDVTAAQYVAAVTVTPDIQLKTVGEEQSWRVRPEQLPAELAAVQPAVAYRTRDAAPAMELGIIPVLPAIRGDVQDHVTVAEDRIQRETLFLLEIADRPVEQLSLTVPPGLTVERVDGPTIEDWDVNRGGELLTVRFRGRLEGGTHFRVISTRPAPPGQLVLRGIYLTDAPNLKGWLGISPEVSVAVRPLEDGRTNIASVRTDSAPAYLKAFDLRYLYEFYEGQWDLELLTETVAPAYSARVLNVLAFRAAQVSASAFVTVQVRQGGLAALDVRLPDSAAAPQVDAPEAVSVEWEDGTGHVRLRGRRTGTLSFRVDYNIVTGMGGAAVEVEPVTVDGAAEQSGVLLLTQLRPDVEVQVGAAPRSLQPAEAAGDYPEWGYRREDPALGAFAYRETGWRLPLTVKPQPLSEQMLRANIPLAKLDTLVQREAESINHLRLYVTNTNRQFLTIDTERLGPGARLIGAYVYGEPVKPFRDGQALLRLPLLENEKAARVGVALVDIIYRVPAAGLGAVGKGSCAAPDLGLNVGQLEWTVRVPEDYRLAAVGGNMDRPVSAPPAVPSLAGRLLEEVARLVEANQGKIFGVLALACICTGLFVLIRWTVRWVFEAGDGRSKRLRWVVASSGALVAVVILIVIAATRVRPNIAGARYASQRASDTANLRVLGLDIALYRNDHNGAFPPSLQALYPEYAETEAEFVSCRDGQLLSYTQPAPDAPGDTVVVYHWHGDLAVTLLADGSVRAVEPSAKGDLADIHTGEFVAQNLPRAGSALALSQRKGFGGREMKTEELAQALELTDQLAAGEPVGGLRERARRVDEALVEANIEGVQSAVRHYMADNEGRMPTSGDDVAGYLDEKRLRDAVRGLSQDELMRGSATQQPQAAPEGEEQRELRRRAEQDESQLAQSRYNLGLAYAQKGDYSKAKDQFERALDLDADYEDARQQLDRTEALGEIAKKAAPSSTYALQAPAAEADKLAELEQSLSKEEAELAEAAFDARPGPGERQAGVGGVAVTDTGALVPQEDRPAAAPQLVAGAVVNGLAVPPAPEIIPEVTRRFGRASLVQKVSGGRSLGALPMQIDFPTPKTVSYEFVKPFVGRASAAVSFLAVRRGAGLATELALAAVALAAFILIRRASQRRAVSFAGAGLLVALAALLAAPPTVAGVFAGAALVTGACLAWEAIETSVSRIRRTRTRESRA